MISVDPAGEDPRLFRSVLFFPDESREVFAGGEAIRRFLDEGEGRFIQSAKSFLSSPSFHATEIRRRSYKLEALVAIILRQILPNTLSPVIVLGTMMVAAAILLESALSFMGLGDPNIMSWGYVIGAGRTVIRQAWWVSLFPGVAILLTVLALNLVGEGLNDALNPRLSRRTR